MTQHEEDEPLDPAVEAVRRKMVRLLAVSGGIMMLGLMAVLAAIVYKINDNSDPAQPVTVVEKTNTLKVPKGAQVQSTTVVNNSITLTLKLADGSTLIRVYRADGSLATSYVVSEE